MEEHIFSVFYSWQSYIGGYANKSYIKDKIISAFNELSISIELLEDSRGSTGAPDIPNAILTKIGKSDIFICDVTPAYTLAHLQKPVFPFITFCYKISLLYLCLSKVI